MGVMKLGKESKNGSKVVIVIWVMTKKSNGTFLGRLNARGYEQVDGRNSDSIAAQVNNPITIQLVLTLLYMNHSCVAVIINEKGDFLEGKFKNGQELYIEVPDRFAEW